MKKHLYTLIGIILWLIIFNLILLIPGMTEINMLMSVCAFLVTRIMLIEVDKKDN